MTLNAERLFLYSFAKAERLFQKSGTELQNKSGTVVPPTPLSIETSDETSEYVDRWPCPIDAGDGAKRGRSFLFTRCTICAVAPSIEMMKFVSSG
jgi:hypothetical protein